MGLSTATSRLVLGGALLLAAGLTACSGSGAESSSQPIPRVGLMHVGTDHIPPSLPTLEARLKQMGWVDGRSHSVTRGHVGVELVVRLSRRRVELHRGRRTLRRISVAVGANGKILAKHFSLPAVSELDGYGVSVISAPELGRNRIYESPGGQLWTVTPTQVWPFAMIHGAQTQLAGSSLIMWSGSRNAVPLMAEAWAGRRTRKRVA